MELKVEIEVVEDYETDLKKSNRLDRTRGGHDLHLGPVVEAAETQMAQQVRVPERPGYLLATRAAERASATLRCCRTAAGGWKTFKTRMKFERSSIIMSMCCRHADHFHRG